MNVKENTFIEVKSSGLLSFLYQYYIIFSVIYLGWRIYYTLNWHVWFSPLLLVCDIYMLFQTAMFLLTAHKLYIPVKKPPLKNVTVDIFIPTYNEPVEIVEMTTIGALKVRGAGKVLVLDDGNRKEVKKRVERLGALYFARGDNTHAKAGNLNFGLIHSDADFILCLDCDHVPAPYFIERTLGYFADPKLAFIQTPQVFYNLDSIQHRKTKYKTHWNEQTMFYECIQLAKNRFNASFFCGSGALIRRKALDEVGGFATGTATEDIHTSLRLHAKGWNSLFVPEFLAYGLAANDLREYHRQRVRWGAGSLGLLFRSADSPVATKGLTTYQRLSYLMSTLAYMLGIIKLIYFTAPILTIIYASSIPQIPLIYYFLLHMLFILWSYAITYLYSRSTYHFPYSEQYDIINIFSNLEAVKGIVRVQKKFGVSIKKKVKKERSFVLFLLIITALIMFSVDIWQMYYWFYIKSVSIVQFIRQPIFIGVVWNSINLLMVLSTVHYLRQYNIRPQSKAINSYEELSKKYFQDGQRIKSGW